MKKHVLACLLVVFGVTLILSACRTGDQDSPKMSSFTTSSGVTICLESSILSPEAECINVVYENPTDTTHMYGTHFFVDRSLGNDEWTRVEFEENLAFLDIGLRLEDHDIKRQSFTLSHFQEPLTKGLYRLNIPAFGADLEFEIRADGALPEALPFLPQQESTMDMTDPPSLEKDWQWYRMWDFIRYFNDRDESITHFVPGEDGLVALSYLESKETVLDQNTKTLLRIVDRKTGHWYDAVKEPSVTYNSVKKSGSGFSCVINGKTFLIRLMGDHIIMQKK